MLEFFRRLTDKHYKMERFSITFSALSVAMVVVLCMCAFGHSDSMADVLVDVPLSTTSFTMSKSGTDGTVERMYVSEDKTRAFLLLHFSTIDGISTDANNWEGFLTYQESEGNPVGLHGVPSGSIYFFGTTGYAGVLLVNEDQFIPQMLNLVVRCNSELVADDDSASSSSEDIDATFDMFDQAEIIFNPGANDVEPLPCLNGEDVPEPTDIYGQSVVAYAEAESRRKLDLTLNAMKTDLEQITEYENRLENDGLIPPARPEYIGNDTIESLGDGTLQLNTDTVCEGGYNFDWRSGSVFSGYLPMLKAQANKADATDDAFFAWMDTQGEEYTTDDAGDVLTWTLADGTTLASLNQSGTSTNRYNRLKSEADTLTAAWTKYITDKQNYQGSLLSDLLVLEADINDVAQLVSVNPGCITDY